MAANFNTNNVNDVIFRPNNYSYVVTVIKLNNIITYARKGVYYVGTLPEGVQSLSATRTGTIEPTATLGPVSDEGVVYHGDTLHFDATRATYYTLSNSWITTATLNFLNTKAVDGVALSNIAAERYIKNIPVTLNDGIAVLRAEYANATTTTTATITSSTTLPAWTGGAVTWWASAATYWTTDSSLHVIDPSEGERSIMAPTATRATDIFVVNRGDGVDLLTAEYIDGEGVSQTVSTTTQSYVGGTAWCGSTITYSATNLPYWQVNASGSIAPDMGPRTATVTGQRYMREVAVNLDSHITNALVYYTDSDGARATAQLTASSSVNAWTGGQISWNSSAATYWLWSTGSLPATENARTVNIVASRYMRPVTVDIGAGVAAIHYTYTDATGARPSVTTNTKASFDAWTGDTIEYSGTRSTYWTDVASGVLEPSLYYDRSVTVTAALYMRDVSVAMGSNVNAVLVTYTNSQGTETSTNLSSSGAVNAWTGARIQWASTAATFWTINSSGTLNATEAARSINTGNATRRPRNLYLYPSSHGIITAHYTNTNNATASLIARRTNNNAANLWQGSGVDASLAVDAYCTGTLSATHADPGTNDVSLTANVSGLTKTFAVQIKDAAYYSNISVTRYSNNFAPITFTPNTVYNTYSVWQGGTITYTYTWTGDEYSIPNITASRLDPGTDTAILLFDRTLATRRFYYSCAAGVSKIRTYKGYSYYYDNTDGTYRDVVASDWYTFDAVASTYWTIASVTPTRVEAGLTSVSISASANKLTRTVTITPSDAWKKARPTATLSYVSSTGTSTNTITASVSATTNTSVSSWQGCTLTISSSYGTYWTGPASETKAAGSANITWTPEVYAKRDYFEPTSEFYIQELYQAADTNNIHLILRVRNYVNEIVAITIDGNTSYIYPEIERDLYFDNATFNIAANTTTDIELEADCQESSAGLDSYYIEIHYQYRGSDGTLRTGYLEWDV